VVVTYACSQTAAFIKESKLMQRLPPHANVLRLIGVVTTPVMCIVTEFCAGGALDHYLRTHARLPIVDKIDVRACVCVRVRAGACDVVLADVS
jgi:hypothetical protein